MARPTHKTSPRGGVRESKKLTVEETRERPRKSAVDMAVQRASGQRQRSIRPSDVFRDDGWRTW